MSPGPTQHFSPMTDRIVLVRGTVRDYAFFVFFQISKKHDFLRF